MKLLNKGLEKADALFVVPIYQVCTRSRLYIGHGILVVPIYQVCTRSRLYIGHGILFAYCTLRVDLVKNLYVFLVQESN